MTYLCAEPEVKPQKRTQWDTDHVVASDVNVSHGRLPSAPDRHTFANLYVIGT